MPAAPRHIRSLKNYRPWLPLAGAVSFGHSQIQNRPLMDSKTEFNSLGGLRNHIRIVPHSSLGGTSRLRPQPTPRWGRFLKGAVNGVVNHPLAGAAWRPSAQTPGAIYRVVNRDPAPVAFFWKVLSAGNAARPPRA